MAIDRRSLVTRHNIRWDHPTGRVALGNGEFCFGSRIDDSGGKIVSTQRRPRPLRRRVKGPQAATTLSPAA